MSDKKDSQLNKQERERERKCFTCQKELTNKWIFNLCTYCHEWGDKNNYCHDCADKNIQPKLDQHLIDCKKSEKVKKDIQNGYWNCKICGTYLFETENFGGSAKFTNIRWCLTHNQEEINKLLDKIEKGKINQEKTLGEILKSEKNQETIYYTCPHNKKMTEPNCSICLAEAEKELKNPQNSIDYSRQVEIKNVCPKCGIILKNLSGSYYQHNGIKTNIQKKIETKHCQPEQIKEYQKKIKESFDKDLINLEKEENEKNKEIQVNKLKFQKQQNFILGGILFSLIILIGIGIYWIFGKNKENK